MALISFQSFLIALLMAISLRLVSNKIRKHLCAIPGPVMAGVTDLWRFRECLAGSLHETQIRLHKEYCSSLVRIGPRSVSVSNTDLIQHIYGRNTRFLKSPFYSIFMIPQNKEFTPSLFTSLDESYHRKIRKAIEPAYRLLPLQLRPRMESTTAILINLLDNNALSGEVMDIGACLQRYAFDVTSELTFGRSLGFMQHACDVGGIMADLRWKVYLGAAAAQIPILNAFLQWNPIICVLFDNHPFVRLATACIQERSGEAIDPFESAPTFMEMCYQAKARNPRVMTDRAICMYCVENMMAGSETTAISLQALFYFLIQNPYVVQALLSEQVMEPEKDILKPAPYLEACIDELFRMHPANGLGLERVTPAGGAMLDGYFVPEGTIVGINPWVVACDEKVFGSEPDRFRPERWLTTDAQTRAVMKNASLTFGAGPHLCIGRDLIKSQIANLVPQVFGLFKFHFTNEDQQREIEGGWLVRQKGYPVTVERK